MVTQAVQMTLSAVLAVVTLSGTVQLWQIYAIAAVSGTAIVFDERSMTGWRTTGRDEAGAERTGVNGWARDL